MTDDVRPPADGDATDTPEQPGPASADVPHARTDATGPRRLWYGVAVLVLVVGVAAGAALLLLGVRPGDDGRPGRVGVLVGLAGLVVCPGGAFLVAAVMALTVALRRNAARRAAAAPEDGRAAH